MLHIGGFRHHRSAVQIQLLERIGAVRMTKQRIHTYFVRLTVPLTSCLDSAALLLLN